MDGEEEEAKELCRVMGNPISCDELSPGRSCSGSLARHCHPGRPLPLLLRFPGCAPQSECPPGASSAVPIPLPCAGSCRQPRGRPCAALGAPCSPRSFHPHSPIVRGLGSAGSQPPFCPRQNPSLTGRLRCRLPRVPSSVPWPEPALGPTLPTRARIPAVGLAGVVLQV